MRPFPPFESADLKELVLNHFGIGDLSSPFELPRYSHSFAGIEAFVDLELKIQAELLREEFHNKVSFFGRPPDDHDDDSNRDPDKRLTFSLNVAINDNTITIPTTSVTCTPPRSQFSGYFVVLQTFGSSAAGSSASAEMQNLCIAFCEHYRKKDGVAFCLGKGGEHVLSRIPRGTTIVARALTRFIFLKTHCQAIKELKDVAPVLETSLVTQQLLRGRLYSTEIKTVQELEDWTRSKPEPFSLINLQDFNKPQQMALALEAVSKKGVSVIQGPPGTGKSHIVCHGIVPQVLSRGEKVMVICNSNVAVDTLVLKCNKVESLRGKLLRCGFKSSVSDEVVNLGLYAEGVTVDQPIDKYGKFSGSDSNATDKGVQDQIRSKKALFTTIHYASKAKPASQSGEDYWNFDTLVLDEAAQLEDSKLFIVLARCRSLKKVVLVGDPRQLQPYVSERLRQQGHGKSTMERLMEATEATPTTAPHVMLEIQFRMTPMLRELVSDLFYDGRLKDAPVVKERGPLQSVALKPLLVINVIGAEMRYSKLRQSYENVAEAYIVKELFDFLSGEDFAEKAFGREEALESEDFCILSPYNFQKDRLRNILCGVDDDNLNAYSGKVFGRSVLSPVKKSQSMFGTESEVDPSTSALLGNIDTVDKFQGSERKVVIISTAVDKQPKRAADPHFIDVACSRAQDLLVVVGSFSLGLATDPNWSFVKQRAQEQGCYFDHEVSCSGSEDPDIKASLLRSKLMGLLERPSKKLKT